MYREFEVAAVMIGTVAKHGERLCPEMRSPGAYLCTLKADHPMPHEASGMNHRKYAEWDDDRSTDDV